MHSLPQNGGGAQQVLLYGRHSTEDQAEAGTIENQREFLRNFAKLYGFAVVDEYRDEGISGTVPPEERLQGRDLVEHAPAYPGAAVLVYRLDRLGRSLRALLDAHDRLAGLGVTIRSATEPFDTATPVGVFLFQLLGSLAQLERATISERMMLGRDRVARNGKWTGGPVPFGYDLDVNEVLIASTRMVEGAGMTEAQVARSAFGPIAARTAATSDSSSSGSLASKP